MTLRARRISALSDENRYGERTEVDIAPRSHHSDRLSPNRVGEARRHVHRHGTTAERTLVRRVVNALSEQPGLDLCAVEVDAEGGTVVLLGIVPSPRMAVEIEDIAGSVDGVLSVNNELVVRSRRS